MAGICDQDILRRTGKSTEARRGDTEAIWDYAGRGVAMMLPRVANAVTVTEADVNVTTPDGTADRYSCIRRAAQPRPFWCGRTGPRPAFRQMASGSPNRGTGAGGASVLPRQEGPDREKGGATPIQDVRPPAQGPNETTATRRMRRRSSRGWTGKRRWPRTGRSARRVIVRAADRTVPRRSAGSRRSGRFIPWRRAAVTR